MTRTDAGPRPASRRLGFRPIGLQDLPRVLEYRSLPEFLRFYEEEAFDEQAARAFLQRFEDWRLERPQRRFAFAVSLARDARVIGICSLRRESSESHVAEIGMELDPAHWGAGIGTEMGHALLRAGFEDLGLHRIQAHCIAENEASRRLLLKLGMRLEGRLRDKHRFKGRHWDELWFGILRQEWDPATVERP